MLLLVLFSVLLCTVGGAPDSDQIFGDDDFVFPEVDELAFGLYDDVFCVAMVGSELVIGMPEIVNESSYEIFVYQNFSNFSSLMEQFASPANYCTSLNITVFPGDYEEIQLYPSLKSRITTIQATQAFEDWNFTKVYFAGANIILESFITDNLIVTSSDYGLIKNCTVGFLDLSNINYVNILDVTTKWSVSIDSENEGEIFIKNSQFFDGQYVRITAPLAKVLMSNVLVQNFSGRTEITSYFVEIWGSTFSGNSDDMIGAVGIDAVWGSSTDLRVSISNCSFIDNHVSADSVGPITAALFIGSDFLLKADILIENNYFSCNSVREEFWPPLGIHLYYADNSSVKIKNNVVDLQCPWQCEKGKYSPMGILNCTNCSKGFFTSNETAENCTACSEGYFAPTEGMGACFPCTNGSYSNATGSINCSSCNAGYYSNLASSKCETCENGTFSNSSGSPMCNICPAGSFSNLGASYCLACSSDSFQDQPKSASCNPCYGTVMNGTQCKCDVWFTGNCKQLSVLSYALISIGIFLILVTILIVIVKKSQKRTMTIDYEAIPNDE